MNQSYSSEQNRLNMDKISNKTILVVDDQPESLQGLLKHLIDGGFAVFVAHSGEDMFQRIERIKPDIVLLDLKMPGIDGFETCRRMKAVDTLKAIPVIFITVITDTVEKVKGFDVGGVDYITKPFQFQEVLARITTHLKLRYLQQQLQQQKERFRALADATSEGILIHEEGRILDVNQMAVKMFNYRRQDLIGKSVLDLLSPASCDAMGQYLTTAENRYRTAQGLAKDGTLFPVEFQVKTMPYPSPPSLNADNKGQRRNVHVVAVRDITWRKELKEENVHLKKEIITLTSTVKGHHKFGEIVGKSPLIQQVYDLIIKAAATDEPVLISGESGTGKELIARTTHRLSSGSDHKFVPVNCGAIPDTLFESELFGYRKGAFTGALTDKPGLLDVARRGTLFLDEVGELSPALQVKLLRVLENKEYTPVGSQKPLKADVRIMAATNRNLANLVKAGGMREDFFYRLHVIEINIPPLRDRKDDIPLLVDHFLANLGSCGGRPAFSGKIQEQFHAYDWPGNVRELENVLRRYVATDRLFFSNIQTPEAVESASLFDVGDTQAQTLRESLYAFEKWFIKQALNQHLWHRANTAAVLDIPIRTLHRKMKKYQLLRSSQGVAQAPPRKNRP